MGVFLELLFRSLETGSVYALATIGIVLIFKTSKTTNFAQGVIGTFHAFVAATLVIRYGYSIWVALPIALTTAFLMGVLIDLVVIRPAKKVSPVAKQIITLGLIMIILGLIPILFGVDPLNLPRFIPRTAATTLTLFGATITYNLLLVNAISIALLAFVFWFLMKTRWGLAIRVTASNESMSRLMGIPTKTITMGSWAVAAMFATLAAIIIAPNASVNSLMMTDVQVSAFFAAVLGGFTSFIGPVFGAYIIALARTLSIYYISSEWGNVIVYFIVLVFLFVKPNGFLGKKPIKKV